MTTYRDTLNRAAALLESSHYAWARGSFAYDRTGNTVPATDPKACSWCTLGAIKKVAATHDEAHDATVRLQSLLLQSVGSWNDTQTDKSVVIATIREAAK
jgi:hypothetical protein